MIHHALSRGLSVLRCHKKAVLWAYLLNLGLAAVLLLPFMQVFDESLGPGLYRQQMVSQIDHDWYSLFREKATGAAASFSPWVSGAGPFLHSLKDLLGGGFLALPWAILSLGALYLFLNTFMMAAVVGSFALDPGGTSSRELLRTGATYLGRFLRLALLALLSLWVLGHWLVEPLAEVMHSLVEEASDGRKALLWGVGLHLVCLPGLLLLNLLFDYAKIKTVVEDRTSVFLAVFSTVVFLRRHLVSVSLLYLVLAGLGGVGMGFYLLVDSLLPQGGGWFLVPAVLFQQLFMVARIFLKLLFFSGQMQFYLATEA